MTTLFKNIRFKMRSCICSVNVLVFQKTNLHVCHLLGLNTPAIWSKANKYLSILCQGLGLIWKQIQALKDIENSPQISAASLGMYAWFGKAAPKSFRQHNESSCLGIPLWEVMDRSNMFRPMLSFQAMLAADEDIQRNPFRQALLLQSSGVPSSPQSW